MTQSHIVIRDLHRTVAGGPPGRRRRRGSVVPASAPPDVRVEVEQLDQRDRAELLRDPQVEDATPIMPTQLIAPVDEAPAPAPKASWGLAAIGAEASRFSGDGVVVAVLDSGIDASHPAFGGVDVVERDFSGSGNGDRGGHGTHCAGTIFGRDLRGRRIGVARGVSKALIGKVVADDGRGDSDMLFRGLSWAIENGADVVSMSIGFDFPGLVKKRTQAGWPVDVATSHALELYRGNVRVFDAFMGLVRAREAFVAGTVVVAAAGNQSRRELDPEYQIAASLPAAADGVVSVGALGRAGDCLDVAPFSNTFPVISAPGVDIESANPGGGRRSLSGTSMACPHVAGAAALWWDAVRTAGRRPTAPTVLAKLRASARTDVLAQHLTSADCGVGLVTAP